MRYEKFQNIGADRVLYGRTPEEVREIKSVSCGICAMRGLTLECRFCKIAATADGLIAAMEHNEKRKENHA